MYDKKPVILPFARACRLTKPALPADEDIKEQSAAHDRALAQAKIRFDACETPKKGPQPQ